MHPTKDEVRAIAVRIRARDNRAELDGEVKMLITLLRGHGELNRERREVIAEFLERHHLRDGPGRRPDGWYRRTNTALRRWAINRRVARWRRVYKVRYQHRRGALKAAFGQVSRETNLAEDVLRKGWQNHPRPSGG